MKAKALFACSMLHSLATSTKFLLMQSWFHAILVSIAAFLLFCLYHLYHFILNFFAMKIKYSQFWLGAGSFCGSFFGKLQFTCYFTLYHIISLIFTGSIPAYASLVKLSLMKEIVIFILLNYKYYLKN